MSLQNSITTTIKAGFFDEQKLNRIISDSNTRRSRFQREQAKQQVQSIGQKVIDQQNAKDVLSSQNSGRTPSSLKSVNAPQPPNFQQQAYRTLSSMRPTSGNIQKQVTQGKKQNGINYIERNKKALENVKQKFQVEKELFEKEQLYMSPLPKKLEQPCFSNTKVISSKVNTGLSRSKSTTSRIERKTIKQKLDMTPKQKLNEDLKNNVTQEKKQGIQQQIDDKYANLESYLQSNLIQEKLLIGSQTETSQFIDECSMISPQSKNDQNLSQMINGHKQQKVIDQQQQHNALVQKRRKQNVKTPISLHQQQTYSSKQKALDAQVSKIKNQGMTRTKTAKDGLQSKALIKQQQKQQEKVEIIQRKPALKQKAVESSLPIKQNKNIESLQKPKKEKQIVPKLKLETQNNDQELMGSACTESFSATMPRQQQNLIEQSPLNLNNNDLDDQISYQTSPLKKSNLLSKEDFLNFSIENIWKEMEEIGRSKKAAQDLFSQFQDQYYNKQASNLYDQSECSPTRRLIDMKNTAAKHQVIGVTEGIRDQTYQLQYITSPDKTYVIKPDEGQIKYENYTQKQTDKLVRKIQEGTVEKIQLKEEKSASPKKSCNSPVKITKKHVQRSSMGGDILKKSPKSQNNCASIVENSKGNCRYQLDEENFSYEDDLNMKNTEDFMGSDDGFSAIQSHSPTNLLIEGRK